MINVFDKWTNLWPNKNFENVKFLIKFIVNRINKLIHNPILRNYVVSPGLNKPKKCVKNDTLYIKNY